eukprot:Plantae.Rhodophyta-Purpureofilum_apyrenoidigerum.ctg5049.p1 GENE.Plantae.Rhodophyta-Purpureofilum_apyrenoidigerum.ctg5049~~Plantae.Rhodophyta-Purpureofilum_apyrenoidigerum.ctg5049.p1  ORF type:complete len:248 (+),score=23.61 Plantae.Rhodophyta-Purpureofilum_apyrenoidigerum.ctg5049:627-1370(+)
MSDDRVEISSESLTLSAYPHARPECPSVPIERGQRGCDLCFCYTCDCHASECRQWPSHYRSSGKRAKWRAVKRVRAHVATACSLANDDGRSVAGHVIELVLHASQDRTGLPLFAGTVDETQEVAATDERRVPGSESLDVIALDAEPKDRKLCAAGRPLAVENIGSKQHEVSVRAVPADVKPCLQCSAVSAKLEDLEITGATPATSVGKRTHISLSCKTEQGSGDGYPRSAPSQKAEPLFSPGAAVMR